MLEFAANERWSTAEPKPKDCSSGASTTREQKKTITRPCFAGGLRRTAKAAFLRSCRGAQIERLLVLPWSGGVGALVLVSNV